MDNDIPSEFEIQSEAYQRLKAVFKHVRGEFHYRKNGIRRARFDIVILTEDGDIRVIIECKKKNRARSVAQYRRYGELTGKPVMYIKGMDQAMNAVELVKRDLREWGI